MWRYAGETLYKLLKKDIISIVLSKQTEMVAANSEVMNQISKLNKNLK